MRSKFWVVWLCVFVAVGPGVACAASDDGHGDSHGNVAAGEHGDSAHAADHEKSPLLSFDPGTALWSIIVFVLLMLLLRAVAWKPILRALQQREEFIRDSLDQARKDREAAEQKLQEYTARIDQGREEAQGIIEQARRDAEIARIRIKEEAQGEAAALLEQAKGEIDVARTTAIKDIYEAGARLATHAAAKILHREVDAAEHERLIAESIEELASRRN